MSEPSKYHPIDRRKELNRQFRKEIPKGATDI